MSIYILFAKKNRYKIHRHETERIYVYTRTVEYKGTSYIPGVTSRSISIQFGSRMLHLPRGDLQVINNDFKRQPRIRRGQIDTIDQAMEKWLWRTGLTFSVQ